MAKPLPKDHPQPVAATPRKGGLWERNPGPPPEGDCIPAKASEPAKRVKVAKPHRERPKRVLVPVHANQLITSTAIERVAEMRLEGKSREDIQKATGLSSEKVSKFVRAIEVPSEFPEDLEGVNEDIRIFTRIAAWKAMRRLAAGAVDQIKPEALPVTAAILIDKHLLLTGNPTSVHLALNASVSHDSLSAELRAAKQGRSRSINDIPTPATIDVSTQVSVTPTPS